MSYYKKIDGENVYLAPLNVEDAEIFTKWMNDKDASTKIGQYINNITLNGEKDYLSNKAMNNHNYSIVRKSDNKLLGGCSLNNVQQIHQRCEVGIVIGDNEDRGKGYGYEALSLLCDYAFNYLNFHSISLEFFASNPTSKFCYTKVGFKEVGIKREAYYVHGKFYDEVIMDILKDEFNSNNKFSSYKN